MENLRKFVNIKLTKSLKLKGKLSIKLRETKTITNMSNLFGEGSSWRGNVKFLSSLPDFNKWDTSQVTNMKSMFNGCESLSQLPDISIWDTKNVTDMSSMFEGYESLASFPNISKWNTKNVTTMSSMFSSCEKMKISLK